MARRGEIGFAITISTGTKGVVDTLAGAKAAATSGDPPAQQLT